MADQKVVLVTGVSSGIGRAIALNLQEEGYRVFGTVRSLETETPEGVEKVSLDVRDDTSIRSAFADILSKTGRIDILINNAGGSLVGAVEETEVAEGQMLFDTNFFGAARMTKAVLPIMRAQRSGRLVFVSSLLGFLPGPFVGYYSATKHALEGFSESLDHEVRALGIRSILIEPGFIRTRIDQKSTSAATTIPDYTAARARTSEVIRQSVTNGDEPSLVAKLVSKAIQARKPRLRYTVGKGARTLAFLRRFLPEAFLDRGLRARFQLD